MKEGLYPVTLEVSMFKGVKHQVIDFGKGNVLLVGGNGVGKSSLIDALKVPYGAKHTPEMPIHAGEERGTIVLTVAGIRNGVEETYEIQYVFTPSNRLGRVSMTRNGEKITASEKTLIREIFGPSAFSLDKFFAASRAEQVKLIKDATGCADKLDALDHKRTKHAEDRKIVASKLKDAKAVNSREARPFNDDDIEKYAKPVDEKAIEEELSSMSVKADKWNENNSKVETLRQRLDEKTRYYRQNTQAITEIDQEIARLQEKRKLLEESNETASSICDEIRKKIDIGEKWLKANPKPSSDAVIDRLSSAREHNRMHSIIQQYSSRQKEIMSMQDQLESLEKTVKDIDKEKMAVIAASQLPVDGLSFSEDSITIHGIPIEQVNTQKKLDLAINITKALNPTLKLIIIGEASLFDREHLEATLQHIEEAGYYWIAEAVDPEGGELEVMYQERTGDDTNPSN